MLQQDNQKHTAKKRVDWVDIAKGICIGLVVMMHSTLGVGIAMEQEGFMHSIVAFAKPFRMPDFFLISGLFLSLTINRPWRLYFDKKVVHFAYFYVLWLTIQFAIKAPGIAAESGLTSAISAYVIAFIQPFGTLWFIYILPVFFLITRATRAFPKWVIFAIAAALQMAPIQTGWLVIDEFASLYVYFFVGYAFAPMIFALAEWAKQNHIQCIAILTGWAILNGILVSNTTPAALAAFGMSWADLPLFSLTLGFAGAVAIAMIATLLLRYASPITELFRHAGENSICIYLAFFLPMAISRVVLTKLVPGLGAGMISLIVTVTAFIAPLILLWLINWSGWGHFLFRRPDWAITSHPNNRLTGQPKAADLAGE